MLEDIFGFNKKRGKKGILDMDLFPSYEKRKKRIRRCARCKKKLNLHAYHIE